MEKRRIYIAIDLKSFYASVECLEHGLDPLTTNLVVADASRTAKTICLAVSPSLKAYGIPGRPRLFEVIKKVKSIKNATGIDIPYIVAAPQMAQYMAYSTRIYRIYLKYVAPEDIHAYSIDEVFIDIANYAKLYNLTPYQIASMMIKDVFQTTGITATVGIGTNLYLAKIAMDIHAKKIKPDKDGGRIAQLDELTYRKSLWNHRPMTDFWRVGKGYAAKLEAVGIYTMGDVARCSLGRPSEYYNEDLLIRKVTVTANNVICEDRMAKVSCEQLDLFLDLEKAKEKEAAFQKERKLQESLIEVKNKYGKNAILKGLNFREGATSISRNQQIGGHKA